MSKFSMYANVRVWNYKIIFLFFFFALILTPDAFSAVTGGDTKMQTQFQSVEDVMTGGYLRLGLIGICGVSAAMAIMKQNVMGMVIAGLGLLFVFLMKGWITTTFTALI